MKFESDGRFVRQINIVTCKKSSLKWALVLYSNRKEPIATPY